MGLRKLSGPSVEPVTLAEAKLHCRVDVSDDDELITALIKAAREQAENRIGRTLIDSTYALTLDEFPDAIRLRMANILSVTTVEYRDAAGTLQTLNQTEYTVDLGSPLIGWIYPAMGFAWPETWDEPNAVTVTYKAGFSADAASVPDSVKAWIKCAVASMYRDRELGAEKPSVAHHFLDGLLDPWAVVTL
jgi:uncharacterized phiE125 gp8 family phage protein